MTACQSNNQQGKTMKDLKTATPEELTTRQRLLEGEITANEEEAAMLQRELDDIYAEQDRRRNQ